MPSSSSSELVGEQKPRILHLPETEITSSGHEAIDLARQAGLHLDPWQQNAILYSCSETRHDTGFRWSAFEVVDIVGRQNGKGGIIEARELAGLVLFGERFLHSAHHFSTTRDAFERMQALIQNCPDLDARVKKLTTGNGNEAITFKGGGRIQYISRKHDAGRGLPPDVVVIDEAYDYAARSHKALLPAMSARPNPQVWLTSSAPDANEHPNAIVLARHRQRALRAIAGETHEPRLLYMEHSAADPEQFEQLLHTSSHSQIIEWLSNRELWRLSNPALGYRLTEEFILAELAGLGPRGFAVERLSIGAWPDLDAEEEGAKPIDPTLWNALIDPTSKALDPVALSIDADLDGNTALAVQGWRTDGHKHAELIEHHAGTGWVVPAVLAIIAHHDPAALIIDASGPASAIVPRLEAAGVEPIVITGRDRAAADQGLVNDIVEGALRIRSCPDLNRAAEAAKWRRIGGQRAFEGSSIAALRALSLAGLGLDMVAAHPPKPPPSTPRPEPIHDTSTTRSGSDLDLATAQF